jgi:23S rRNA pseudouridine1911/1915/1917 synthase
LPRDARLREIAARLNRQALHATRLGFMHPATNQFIEFATDPPDDMKQAIAALRG